MSLRAHFCTMCQQLRFHWQPGSSELTSSTGTRVQCSSVVLFNMSLKVESSVHAPVVVMCFRNRCVVAIVGFPA